MEIIKGIFSESFWYIAPLLMALTVAIAGFIERRVRHSNNQSVR